MQLTVSNAADASSCIIRLLTQGAQRREGELNMHYFYRFTLFAVLAGTLAATALAADKPQDGKAMYRNNCKVCHDKGSKSGVYTPMTLTQDQWRRFFTTKLATSHKSAVHPTIGKKLFEILTPDQIKAIQRFCVDHAADSEQPATCG